MQAHVRRAVDRFLERLPADPPGDAAVVLYGSAARNEHVEGRSDLNLLVVTGVLDPDRLLEFGRAFEPLEGQTRTPPLLFTVAEWARSADVFPIEIADMQVARIVLRGTDPVAGQEVSRPNLRRALERELRGKLVRLRQAYAIHGEDDKALTRIGVQSAATIAALLRGALVLARDPVPAATGEMLRRAGTVLHLDPAPVASYFALRTAGNRALGRAEFARYLETTEAAVRFIDQFHIGGN
jgi:predicted nucleotidyltransferase